MFALGMAASLFLVSCGGEDTPATDNATDTTATADAPVADEPVADEPAPAADEASIVGEWQMTGMDMGMELTPEQEADMAAMVEKMAAETKWNFNADGTMLMISPEGEEAGTYEVVEGDMGKELKATAATNGEEQTMMITELTANALVLTMNIEGTVGTMTFSR